MTPGWMSTPLKEGVPHLQRLAERDPNFRDVDDAVSDRLKERMVQIRVLVIVVPLVCTKIVSQLLQRLTLASCRCR